jgi:DNA-directed RNA polymerase specialized sigma24 family protein
MTATPASVEQHTVHTSASLLQGMRNGDDDRWAELFRTYGPVIRGFALKAGLTETESDEVVQETCIGVARNVGEFHYDPAKCRFKTWLLNQALWRVKNHQSAPARLRPHKTPLGFGVRRWNQMESPLLATKWPCAIDLLSGLRTQSGDSAAAPPPQSKTLAHHFNSI